MSSERTRSQPCIGRPRISIGRAFVVATSSSDMAGSTRTITPPCPLAATAMLPPIRKASPPNICFSVSSCSPATSSRIRSASASSYAMVAIVHKAGYRPIATTRPMIVATCPPRPKGDHAMADKPPIDLYIAAYSDPDAARADWDGLKQLARDRVITVDAMVLVRRDADGKIDVEDNGHEVGVGATLGVVGGAIIGLIFPPSLLASAVVGGGIGAGAGALPPNSSGIVAVFEERWVTEIEKQLRNAAKVEKHQVDADSVESVKAEAAKSGS